jgi:sarcosine oxidase subunit gamma
MVDALVRTHPLQAWAPLLDDLPETARATPEPFLAMVDLRVHPAGPGAQSAAARLGTPLPGPNTWAATEAGAVAWLGPDEWLVTSAVAAPEALEADLRAAVVPHGGAAVDVSAQRTALRLHGARTRDLLAKGCALDLHPRAFGAGACAQTTVGHAGVVLLALGGSGEDFRVLVRSSFAGYLADWLLDAALEFRPCDDTDRQ